MEKLSEAQLQSLLSDERELEAFFSKLECVHSMNKIRDDLRLGNAETAKKNMALGARVQQLQEETEARQVSTWDRTVSQPVADIQLLLNEIVKLFSVCQ